MFLIRFKIVGTFDTINLLFLPYCINDQYYAQGYKYGQHIMSFKWYGTFLLLRQ